MTATLPTRGRRRATPDLVGLPLHVFEAGTLAVELEEFVELLRRDLGDDQDVIRRRRVAHRTAFLEEIVRRARDLNTGAEFTEPSGYGG